MFFHGQESLSQFSSLVQLNTLNLASRFYLVKCNECKEPVIFQQSYNLSCSVFDIFSKELHLNLLGNLFSTPPFLCASFYTNLQVQIKPSSAVICSPTPPLHMWLNWIPQLYVTLLLFIKRELTCITDLERRWKKSLPQLFSFWSGKSCLRKVWTQD